MNGMNNKPYNKQKQAPDELIPKKQTKTAKPNM